MPSFISCFVVIFSFRFLIHPLDAFLVSTGQTLLLNDVPYYVPAKAFTTVSLPSTKSLNALIPVTVVGVSLTNSSQGTLETIIDAFGADDVWNEAFLEGKSKRGRLMHIVLVPTKFM